MAKVVGTAPSILSVRTGRRGIVRKRAREPMIDCTSLHQIAFTSCQEGRKKNSRDRVGIKHGPFICLFSSLLFKSL